MNRSELESRLFRLKRWVAHARADRAFAERPTDVESKRRTRAELVNLAWPITVAMAGETVMGLVDTKLVAGLGAGALAGVGYAGTLMYLGYAIIFGIMRGVKVRTAYAVGQERAHDGFRYAEAGMWMGAVLGLGIFVLGRDIGWLLAC